MGERVEAASGLVRHCRRSVAGRLGQPGRRQKEPERGRRLPSRRTWAMAGAVTCVATHLLEFFPTYMGGWELRAVHPVLGLAWIGGGELVALAAAWIEGGRLKGGVRAAAAWVLAAAAFASLPAAVWISHNRGLVTVELPSMQLSLLPGTVAAPNLWSWILQNGITYGVAAAILPLLILVPAVTLLATRSTASSSRVPLALAFGPVLAALVLSYRQISWWNGVDTALLLVLV